MGVTKLACKPKTLVFSCLSLFSLFLLQSVTGRELKCAVIIFRHGDRTPLEGFPNDPHKESDWPQGYGQLTKIGIQAQYELGLYLRRRYAKFLSFEYKREENFFVSTDYDRTIMSSLATLAALYPPTGNQIWNPHILWQPIPVHVVPLYRDFIHPPFPGCARYEKIQNETMESSIFQKMLPDMKFFHSLAKYTGLDVATLKYLKNGKALNLYTSLMCKIIHNYPLPSWVTKEILDELNKLSDLTHEAFFGIYKKNEKSKLQGGVLVKTILNDLIAATASGNKRKLVAYSAHSPSLAAIQMALDIYSGKVPPYTSCHFVELYQDSKGQYTVEMFFRNDTSRKPYPLHLPGCTHSCPLGRFAELVSPIIVDDWEKACKE
ncbi:prostatic acid phosphatase-like [Sceloporus undulatus]|uniref:prostatic acid phosphatase-like n=1 Tax=Sceloporus undulatus TaxID=8520 RepID=UPI001C4B4171|nr:prostatic acid phosphatase-like [Sceloporus undulatus]